MSEVLSYHRAGARAFVLVIHSSCTAVPQKIFSKKPSLKECKCNRTKSVSARGRENKGKWL